jgi:hypothetical protein
MAVMSAYAQAALCPLGRFLVPISVRGLVDLRVIVRLEELGKLKNPMTTSGTEPATFLLVAWCLNQLRYHVPPKLSKLKQNLGRISCYSSNNPTKTQTSSAY